MIIGAIFYAFVAACALMLLFAILRGAIEDDRAAATATAARSPQQPPARVTRPIERTGRFDRDPNRVAEPTRRH